MSQKKLDPSESDLRKSASEWLGILTRAAKKTADEVPPGFKTVAQIARETNRGESQTRRMVKEAVRLGLAEERKFSVDVGSKLYPTPHYKIRETSPPAKGR